MDIFDGLNLTDAMPLPYRVIIYGKKLITVENVKAIKSFSLEEVILTLKQGELIITGKNLTVLKFCLGDVSIKGEVYSFKAVNV